MFDVFEIEEDKINKLENEGYTRFEAKMLIRDESIVELRKRGNSYKDIRLKLGNPPNKKIREVLLEHCPELAGDTKEWRNLINSLE